MWFFYAVINWFWSWSKSIVFMNHVHIHNSSNYQDLYFIYWSQLFLYWIHDLWKQVVFSQIILKIIKLKINSWFIYHLHSQTNFVIIMSAHQISDLAYLIDTWSWSQIMISTQLIVSVNVSVVSWSWNIANSYDLLKFSWKIWIF